jgi:cytochrome c oxidase subunit 4
MHEHGHEHHDEHDAHDSHGGVAKYLYVFGALTVLTGASFFTYSDFWHQRFGDTPAVGWTFMMAVSCCKALLVMLFFMHLKYEASWKYVLTIPATVMAIFLILALVPDIKWRFSEIAGGRAPSADRLRHAADPRDAHAPGTGTADH